MIFFVDLRKWLFISNYKLSTTTYVALWKMLHENYSRSVPRVFRCKLMCKVEIIPWPYLYNKQAFRIFFSIFRNIFTKIINLYEISFLSMVSTLFIMNQVAYFTTEM